MINFRQKEFNNILALEAIKDNVATLRENVKEYEREEKVDVTQWTSDWLKILLLKYVYNKTIVNNNAVAQKLLLVTTENFVKTKFYGSKTNIIDLTTITDNILDKKGNIVISDRSLEKCLLVLEFFECLKMYSCCSGMGRMVNEIQNYDKFVTQEFFRNIEKLNIINITDGLEYYVHYAPIILTSNNKPDSETSRSIKEYCEPDNFSCDMNLVIDWLFQNCKHVETFEIGFIAALTQVLYVTEGFDAFKKFLSYAESLDDENRIKLVNTLINYYNSLSDNIQTNNNIKPSNYFTAIPKIIGAFNLCDKFCDMFVKYPKSIIDSFIVKEYSPLFAEFEQKATANVGIIVSGIKNFRNNPENIVDAQTFGREKTMSMQAIINEYDKLVKR
jgi:hypothetical protein